MRALTAVRLPKEGMSLRIKRKEADPILLLLSAQKTYLFLKKVVFLYVLK